MTSRCLRRGLSVQSGRPGNPFKSFMKHKLKVTASQVRKTVRKLMPRPCRAFSPTPSRLQFCVDQRTVRHD